MIFKCTSSVPKEYVFARLLYLIWGALRLVASTPRPVVGALRLFTGATMNVVGTPRLVAGAPRYSQVLPGTPKVQSGAPRRSQTYHTHSHGTPVPVIRDPSYSEGLPECSPLVWYSPEIDASKFTLHILSDTTGVFQRLKYILLM